MAFIQNIRFENTHVRQFPFLCVFDRVVFDYSFVHDDTDDPEPQANFCYHPGNIFSKNPYIADVMYLQVRVPAPEVFVQHQVAGFRLFFPFEDEMEAFEL